MSNPIDPLDVLARRLKLRDLHTFLAVIEHGSMARAAEHLGVTQPAVSQVILDLESALGVRLLDRSPRGTEPTDYGRALAKGGIVIFDNLKQTVKEIEFIANPTAGEVRVGCPETVAAILYPIVEQLCGKYPGLVVHVIDIATPTLDVPALRHREIDVALLRVVQAPSTIRAADDLTIEVLFNDEMRIVADHRSPYANIHPLKIEDLESASWSLPPRGSLNRSLIIEVFGAAGIKEPKVIAETFSMQLRTNLLAGGRCLTVLPLSIVELFGARHSIVALPIDLPRHDWPVIMATLKDRTLNPVAHLFMDAVREQLVQSRFTRS